MVNRVLLRPGKPLDQITYAAIAGKGEITGLRIHDDVEAAESARSIDARAYTVGRHVVFGQGEYQPGSDRTNRLPAHELAHMQQQRLSRGDGAPLRVDLDRDGHWEREARSAAMADAPVTGHAPHLVQRDAGNPHSPTLPFTAQQMPASAPRLTPPLRIPVSAKGSKRSLVSEAQRMTWLSPCKKRITCQRPLIPTATARWTTARISASSNRTVI